MSTNNREEFRRAPIDVDEEARRLYENLEMNVNNGGTDVTKSSSRFNLSKLSSVAKPLGLIAAGVGIVTLGAMWFGKPSGDKPSPADTTSISPETQELIKQNQSLQKMNETLQLELLGHAKDTRPWVLLNTCLWNCEGRSPSAALASLDKASPTPSPSPSVSPSPAPSPSPETVKERVIAPVIINSTAAPQPDPQPSARQYTLLPRYQLNTSYTSFRQGVNNGYDRPYFNTMLDWYEQMKDRDPNFFYNVIVPQAAIVPTHLTAEQYDALYLVWSGRN